MQERSDDDSAAHPARLPKLPRGSRGEDFDGAWVSARREAAEKAAGTSLPFLGRELVPNAAAQGNVENLVGWAQVPVGLAGPLLVHGEAGTRSCYVPMATTEGALVASTSRGMGLLAAGGGATARVTQSELSQHPMLVYASAMAALEAAKVAEASLERFQALVAEITRHGALSRLETQVLGRRLLLRLLFTTGDAIGINMAAHGAELCSKDLGERTGAVERFVHGQDVEKRANARAMVEGRGRSVIAEAIIPRGVLAEKARTSPEALVRVLRTYAVGYAQLGTQNWTVQAANTIAAVFLACGQDIAYVTECSTGLLDFDVTDEGDLHASVTLPTMLVGTVGGGSGQGTAAECLRILGCEGAGKANSLAEIIAATVLAGDLSLMAAFASHEFVAAHEKLGRNRPASSGPPPSASQ